MVGMLGEQNYLADSAMVDARGHFTLRREHPLAAGFYTFLLPGNKNFSILIDQEQHFTLRTKANDIYPSMKVEGAIDPDLFFQNVVFQSAQDPVLLQMNKIIRSAPPGSPEYEQAKTRQDQLLAERKAHLDGIFNTYPNSFFTKFKIAGQNPELPDIRKPNGDIDTVAQVVEYRKHFWDGVDFNDDRLLHTPVVVNKLKRYIKELTPQRPDSIIAVSDELIRRVIPTKEYFKFFSNWIALQYENGRTTVMDGEAVYVHIIQEFFTPELAFWDKPENIEKLRKHAWEMEASTLGRKGPDVVAMDVNGVEKSIYGIKAPIIVIFMFSPHCEHCQEQAPELERIYRKWKDKGVDFFGIGVNTETEEWRAFVKKSFSFTNVYDPTNRAIYAKYFVDNTPELYVLDKDRTIIAKNLHADQLETIFEREFRKMEDGQ